MERASIAQRGTNPSRLYSRFLLDVTKIKTKELSILLSFYFNVVLQQLTFIYTNFRFERALRFSIEDAGISRLLRAL